MSDVINKAQPDGDPAFSEFQIFRDANTPEFPPAQWVRNSPNLAGLIGSGSDFAPQVPRIYWIVDPPNSQNLREMTAPEKAVVDGTPSNIADARVIRKSQLDNQTFSYILGRYPTAVYQGLLLIGQQANGQRGQYITDWLDWTETVYDALAAAENLVDAAATVPAVEAITLDLSPFDGTDPLATIQGAMNL